MNMYKWGLKKTTVQQWSKRDRGEVGPAKLKARTLRAFVENVYVH